MVIITIQQLTKCCRPSTSDMCRKWSSSEGVGCSLALAGDFVFASKSAYFLQAFVNIGLVPDGGSAWLAAGQLAGLAPHA